jgi:hypothetical protein
MKALKPYKRYTGWARRALNVLRTYVVKPCYLLTVNLKREGPGETQVNMRDMVLAETKDDQRKWCGNHPLTVLGVLQQCSVHHSHKLRVGIAWDFLGSTMFCNWAETAWRAYNFRHTPGRGTIGGMAARDPFQLDRDQTERDTEYGYGAGKFPDPHFDYSGGGSISQIPIADPTRHEQELELAMIRRTDVSDPNDQPSPYVMGNTDRFGAQPPLVRETKPPKYQRPQRKPPNRMQRQW